MNDLLADDVFSLIYDGANYPASLQYTKTGLTPGKYYRFKVSSMNRNGESAQSAESKFLAADFPAAPSQPYLIQSTSVQVTFGWYPPSDNGGGQIIGYQVYFKKRTQDESLWTLIGATDLNTLTYTHTGLTGTEDVQYKVRAISTRGEGSFSIRATFILAAIPTTTVPVKVSSTRSSILVSWALVSDGGSPVLGYLLYQLNVTTGGEYLVYNGSSIPTITSFNSSGLFPGHYYQYRVRALNRVGNGPLSAFSPQIRAAQVPARPEAPIYLRSTATSITIGWQDVDDNGGSLITSYKVYVDTGDVDVNTFNFVHSTLDLEYTLDNTVLTQYIAGEKYRFRVTAVND